MRQVRQNSHGHEQVLSTETAGAVLGLVALLDGGCFYSTVIANTDCKLLCILKDDFQHLCHSHPEILWNVSRMLAQRVRDGAEMIENLALRNVQQRLAWYLVSAFQTAGEENGAGGRLHLTLSRSELAARLGTSREVISRAFAQFERCGLVSSPERRIAVIPDLQALRNFADSDGLCERT